MYNAPFGAEIRAEAMESVLSRNGHEAVLLQLNPKTAFSKISPAFVPFLISTAVLILKTFGWVVNFKILKLLLNVILSSWGLLEEISRGGYDVIQAETHLAGLCAWVLRHQVPFLFYLDIHGIAEEVRADPVLFNFAVKVEKLLLDDSSGCICVSGTMRRFLRDFHQSHQDLFIECHCGTEEQDEHAHFSLPLKVIFAGGFSYYEKVMDFIDTAKLNSDPNIEFYLLGGGDNEKEILAYIKRNNIKITWMGRKSRQETLKVLKQMHIGVAPSTVDISRKVASPIKVLDYAACGLAVVTVDVDEWSRIFQDYKAGIVCKDSCAKAFLEAIITLKDKDTWSAASRNALKLVKEKRTWAKTIQPLADHYTRLEQSGMAEYPVVGAVEWMMKAQYPSGEGEGFLPYYVSQDSRIGFYPEITGYAVSTFSTLFRRSANKLFFSRARKAADALIRIQQAGGGIPGLTGPGTEKRVIYAFDQGIMAAGLLDFAAIANSLPRSEREKYLNAGIQAAEFLIKIAGSGFYYDDYDLEGNPLDKQTSCITIKNCIALVKAYALTKDKKFLDTALKIALYGIRNFQHQDGAFSYKPDIYGNRFHYHCYAVEGLIAVHQQTHDPQLAESIIAGAGFLARKQERNGGFSNTFPSRADCEDIPVAAQASMIWKYSAGNFIAEKDIYERSVHKAHNYLKQRQIFKVGPLYGGFPIWRNKNRLRYLLSYKLGKLKTGSWAAEFVIDEHFCSRPLNKIPQKGKTEINDS